VPSVAFEDEAQLAGAGDEEVGRAILVAESVTADDDRVGPARDQAGNVLDDDRLAEDVPPRMLRIVPLGDFHIS
jgi:hypothetical protein